MPQPSAIVRSDNGLVFASRRYRKLIATYGLRQESIHPHTPEQNGVVEAYHKTFKRECVWQHRFASLAEATPISTRWINYYNTKRPHSSLGYLTPAGWRAKAEAQISALPV